MGKRYIPGPETVEDNAGHEAGHVWADMLAKRVPAIDPLTVSSQPLFMSPNTGEQRPGPNAMWTESPDSGFMGGVMGPYTGPTA